MADPVHEFEADANRPAEAVLESPLPRTISLVTPTPPSLHDRPTLLMGATPPPAVVPPLTENYGKYQLLQQVAAGGMGVVFKARDQALDRIVALKTIRTGVLAQPAEVERFYLEARAAAQLHHPHIIPIYEIDQHAGQHYFTMEFAPGGTLDGKQAEYHANPRTAAELMIKICRAVHYAHEQGILHRDLKPSNILLDANGQPLVSDFGLAKFVDSAVAMTQTGQQLGTPAYMAPEQTSSAAGKVTARSDVWALGVILYELLTARRPFNSLGSDLSHEICVIEPPRPSRLRTDLGKDLETIILKCLEKQPGHRYASAAELASELEHWLRGEPIAARPLRWPLRTWRRFRRRPVAGSLVLVPVLAIVALLALLVLRDPDRWDRNLRARLEDGRTAILVGDNGRPAGYRWRYGRETTTVMERRNEAFTLSSLGVGLLELLSDPGITSFRYRAQVMHLSTNKGTEVGIYFAQSPNATQRGIAHSVCRLAFNDREDLRPFNPRGNHVQAKLTLIGDPIPRGLATSSLKNTHYFPPLEETERRWRDLAVEVDSKRVRFYWEGTLIEDTAWTELADYAVSKWIPSLESMKVWAELNMARPTFSPRQGLGLFVHEGAASFQNVVVEPLVDRN